MMKRRIRWCRTRVRRRDESGAAAPEMLVVVPTLMLILMLVVQWSVQLYNDRLVHAAAREAAVAAASWDGTETSGRQAATQWLSGNGNDLSNTDVKVTVKTNEVTVTVSGDVSTLVPGMSKRITATATVPREKFAQ
jgi:Flp pilus assembly protein TadG